jgi:hypothetical protein
VVVVVVLAGRVDGLVDYGYVLTVDRRSARHVDSGLVDYGSGLLVLGETAGGVNCLVDPDSLLVDGAVGRRVDSGAYARFLTVAGLEAGAVFTLGDVDRGVVVVAVRLGVVLNVGLGVRGLRSDVGTIVSSGSIASLLLFSLLWRSGGN